MVAFRIGSLLLYPQVLLAPLGAAFFLVIGYKRLLGLSGNRSEPVRAMATACVLAVAGSLFLSDHADAAGVLGGQSTFGAYWGALIGAALWALVAGKPVMPSANSLAAGVMAGGAVARLGCVFAGCCRGVVWLPVFSVWPAYDIGALVLALVVGMWWEKRRRDGALISFLVVYGVLRFLLEFARDVPGVGLGLTVGQWLAVVQAGVGAAVLSWGREGEEERDIRD